MVEEKPRTLAMQQIVSEEFTTKLWDVKLKSKTRKQESKNVRTETSEFKLCTV
jgi:hypothetical protein